MISTVTTPTSPIAITIAIIAKILFENSISHYALNTFFKVNWWALGKPTTSSWFGGPRMTHLSAVRRGQLAFLSYYAQKIIKEFKVTGGTSLATRRIQQFLP